MGERQNPNRPVPPPSPREEYITLFLCGDVMLGRGVDQILPHSCHPRLHERYVTSAVDYVRLAERANGPISAPVDHSYPWGEALPILEEKRPDLSIINLETSVTTSEDYAGDKGIHYRMHPANLPVLTEAGIDCCVLANNHVMDWGEAGLVETLETLAEGGIPVAGAGADDDLARAPVSLEMAGQGRVLVVAFGATDCGIPPGWSAGANRPGVYRIPDFSPRTLNELARAVDEAKGPRDIAVASVHWGGNWGYEIPAEHRRFAHGLIDQAGFDLIHGHSSHHPKAVEIHGGRPILYGCGDFLDDYEGIRGYEAFRDDLVLMYFPTIEVGTGRMVRLEMTPLRIRNMRLIHTSTAERDWLHQTLDREYRRFGTSVERKDGDFVIA